MSTQCQIMVNYLSNIYWEILFGIGINGGERSLDEIVYKMFFFDGDNQITQHNPIFARIRDAYSDKERNEHLLDFLKKIIRERLTPNDLGLSLHNRCNFLGDDPDDIANWGREGGPHFDGDSIDDFLKHHYPFLNPLHSRLTPRTISFPSEEPNSQPETTFEEEEEEEAETEEEEDDDDTFLNDAFTSSEDDNDDDFDSEDDLTPSSPPESEGTTSIVETKDDGGLAEILAQIDANLQNYPLWDGSEGTTSIAEEKEYDRRLAEWEAQIDADLQESQKEFLALSNGETTTSTETKEGGYKKYKRKSRRKRKRKKKRKTFLRKRPFSKKGRKKKKSLSTL